MMANGAVSNRERREAVSAAGRRCFLFLQGPIGLFFSRLARRLRDDGHAVHRINLHGGERLFWRLPGAADFRGDVERWPAFVSSCLDRWQVTDLVLFGDCRPLHRVAMAQAAGRGVRVHVFEEGYLRPNWVTLEVGGVNANSSLPRDSDDYRQGAVGLPPWTGAEDVNYSFPRRAAEDVAYHTAMVLAHPVYPGYRTHRPWHPFSEYAHGAGRFLRRPLARLRGRGLVRDFAARSQPFFLFPLQLDADTQIRHHSDFGSMEPAVRAVIESFARFAPADALLVLTEHPLDTGVVDLRRVAVRCAAKVNISGRVIYLESGSPPGLLQLCRGLVTVNSTLGLHGLECGVPVVALGRSIYNLPGLTFQGGLDEFWRGASPADATLFDAFRRVVAARTQIHGGFYSTSAIALAVSNAAHRLQCEAAAAPAALAPQRARERDFAFADDLRPLTQ
jgi:capsular polysaccharide export protein